MTRAIAILGGLNAAPFLLVVVCSSVNRALPDNLMSNRIDVLFCSKDRYFIAGDSPASSETGSKPKNTISVATWNRESRPIADLEDRLKAKKLVGQHIFLLIQVGEDAEPGMTIVKEDLKRAGHRFSQADGLVQELSS